MTGLAKLFIAYRRVNQITQLQFGRELGISNTLVCKIEASEGCSVGNFLKIFVWLVTDPLAIPKEKETFPEAP